MATWQFVMGPASGGHDVAVVKARSRTLNFRLTDPHDGSLTMDANQPAAKYITELATDLHAIRNGQILYRGRIGPTADEGDDKSGDTIDVKSFDYRELLKRRRLTVGDSVGFSHMSQEDIVWGLIMDTQLQAGGALNIVKGDKYTTGVIRDRTYVLGDSIGELIQQLSEVIDGFDWDIVPVDSTTMALNIFYPQRGSNKGVVLEYGGLIRAYRREVDPGNYANSIRVTGDSSVLSATGVTRVVSDVATRPEGRWDGVFGTDIQTSTALNERADWQILDAQVVPVSYSLTFKPNAWKGPDHVWLGDTVEVVINSGRLSVDTSYRVYEMAITLDEDGNETVVVQVAGSNPNYKVKPAAMLRRLTQLERR